MIEIEQLKERLSDFGFETEENEEDVLAKSIKRAEQTIINYCNCERVPQELIFVAVDMACGEYLAATKCTKGTERGVKSVSEGDVSVSFDDEPVEKLADELLSSGREEMASFRRMKW